MQIERCEIFKKGPSKSDTSMCGKCSAFRLPDQDVEGRRIEQAAEICGQDLSLRVESEKQAAFDTNEEGKNLADVRAELGVDSFQWKVERRCLERIGHVFRMDDGRMTKQVVLGWMSELEKWERKPGTTRKTVTYWRKMLREAGMDISATGELTADRKIWRIKIMERMKHLQEYKKSKGHKWTGGEVARDVVKEEVVVFDCSVCGRICKSKAGLTIHKKRMHEVSIMQYTRRTLGFRGRLRMGLAMRI